MEQLIKLFESHFGQAPQNVECLPAGGSNRVYYRMTASDGTNVIGAVGTSFDENNAFITLSRHFTSKNLPVPNILSVSDDGLRYLQTDLGNRSLFEEIKAGDYSHLKATIRLLPRLQVESRKNIKERALSAA